MTVHIFPGSAPHPLVLALRFPKCALMLRDVRHAAQGVLRYWCVVGADGMGEDDAAGDQLASESSVHLSGGIWIQLSFEACASTASSAGRWIEVAWKKTSASDSSGEPAGRWRPNARIQDDTAGRSSCSFGGAVAGTST